MRYFKVLNKDLRSPMQKFQYKMDKWYYIRNFCNHEYITCAPGFYYLTIPQILSWYNRVERDVYEVDIRGRTIVLPDKARSKSGMIVKKMRTDTLAQCAIEYFQEKQYGHFIELHKDIKYTLRLFQKMTARISGTKDSPWSEEKYDFSLPRDFDFYFYRKHNFKILTADAITILEHIRAGVYK